MSKKKLLYFSLVFLLLSCASLYESYDKKIHENKEFSDSIKVEEIPPQPEDIKGKAAVDSEAKTVDTPSKPPASSVVVPKVEVKAKNSDKKNGKAAKEEPLRPHEPALEDGEGFNGRRPLIDPFVIGEEIEYAVSYFAVEAGRFTMGIQPFVEVNGHKSYKITLHAVSSSVFSLFYAVDDYADTYLDYETLVPYSYTIRARESKQVRDVKNIFNWQTLKSKTWDKKVKKGKDPEEKNFEWDLLPFSQNVISVGFYMRVFRFAVGKEIAVRVAHEGENIIMKAKVLREEKLSTAIGKLDTFVLKPEFEIDGVFKPVGDVFMWVTKDDYHRIVRIESKIKIGKLVVSVEKMKP